MPEMSDREPAALATLERTRSAVLNILVAEGLGIAASGFLLRWRDRGALFRAHDQVRQGMLGGLLILVAASYLARRVLGSRSALLDPARRARRFFRAHVISALIGSLAVPLGLAYGWTVRPRLDAVAPFWVAALALGFLALPRASELDDLDVPPSATGPSEPTG
jgi:hypothetical protein